MSTFAIGDIQGCYEEFRKLLEIIQFDEKKDQLWLTGDLVNRGPQSLEVLNYLYSIDQSIITVLGNHDLHLIALALSNKRIESKDESLQAILKSKNKINLIEWLRSKPLMHFDQELNTVLVHAGIHPDWSVK
ncbi:MAG: symmetrical bis(5'-nucleosyl)-tetraphosphatase, partial [Gammaproteobacteria bacterium]|nr:symmetrical bis(5'-nucleosyl)-tetraphosphatase [Gammaproteobacteria bacterium]